MRQMSVDVDVRVTVKPESLLAEALKVAPLTKVRSLSAAKVMVCAVFPTARLTLVALDKSAPVVF